MVTVIITVLASLLLPALREARERGRRAVCMSNLRQQGIGWLTYAADYDSRLPAEDFWSGQRYNPINKTPRNSPFKTWCIDYVAIRQWQGYNTSGGGSFYDVALDAVMAAHNPDYYPFPASKQTILECPSNDGSRGQEHGNRRLYLSYLDYNFWGLGVYKYGLRTISYPTQYERVGGPQVERMAMGPDTPAGRFPLMLSGDWVETALQYGEVVYNHEGESGGNFLRVTGDVKWHNYRSGYAAAEGWLGTYEKRCTIEMAVQAGVNVGGMGYVGVAVEGASFALNSTPTSLLARFHSDLGYGRGPVLTGASYPTGPDWP